MMNTVLLGAPGVGKGTQSVKIVSEWGLEHISTGDILRQAVSAETPLGVQAKSYMDSGELVPDFIVIGLVKSRIMESGMSKGFVLDGFPRNESQAAALDRELEDMGVSLDAVISIDVPRDLIVQRLTTRRACEACGRITNASEGSNCVSCGAALIQRADDNEATVRNRLAVYDRATAPLIDYYRSRGVLREIDGSKSVNEVWESIKSALGK